MRRTTTFLLLVASITAALVAAVPAPPPFQPFRRGPSWITYGSASDRRLAPSTPNFNTVLPNTVRQTTEAPASSPGFTFTTSSVPSGLDLTVALATAKEIMDSVWKSSQPVNVAVTFDKIGGKDVLANGEGVTFFNSPELNELLPITAAEAILGSNLNDDNPEMTITMNTIDWYVGADGDAVPTGKYDFVTVLLHEVYHHLMFSGRFSVDVSYDTALKQSFRWSAGTVPSRFDKFMANEEECRCLGYLTATAQATELKKSTLELMADSLTNGKLYFADNKFGPIAKLHAPRVWVPKGSAYHLDPINLKGDDALMGPTIASGKGIRKIGLVIQQMQNKFLNRSISGAPECTTLSDPTPANAPTPEDRVANGVANGVHGAGTASGTVDPPGPVPTPGNERRIGGMKVWVFALVVTFSIIGGLLLIGLCIFLVLTCLRARKKNAESTEYEYDHQEYDSQGNPVEQDIETGEGERLEGDETQGAGSTEYESGAGDSGAPGVPGGALAAGAGGALSGGALAGGALAAGAGGALAAGAGAAAGSGGNGSADGANKGAAGGAGGVRSGEGSQTDGMDGADASAGGDGSSSKKSSKKKKSSSRGGTHSDGLDSGGSDFRGKGGASVCPSTTRSRNKNNIAEPPSCAPRTFDPSSVPSASGHKAARRNGTPSKSTIKKSRSGKGSGGSGGTSSGNGGSSLNYSEYYGSQRSKSKSGGGSVTRSKSGKSIKKPGSVCPPTTVVDPVTKSSGGSGGKGSSGGGGGQFDCDTTTMDPFDCDTIFDCDTTSKKTATKFAVSEKPIPKLYNPSTSSKSRMLYLDSETTDSTHLRAYERASAQKNPIAKPSKKPTAMKKKSTAHVKPMSIAPTTTVASESTGVHVPSTKVPQHGGPHTKSSKHSKTTGGVSTSIYNSTDCSCSECMYVNSCDYDYDYTKGTSCDFSGCTSEAPMPKKTCKSSAAKSTGASTCKKSSSKKSIHSEGAKSVKSSGSCKKSSSSKNREEGKENEPSNCKKSSSASCKKSSSGKSISGKSASGKSAKSGGSSCKRSKSKESIKAPPKVAVPPSCKPPSVDGSSGDYETAPTSSYYNSSLKPSSCPPSEEKPEPAKLKSCCPSSEKKTATRYTSGKHHRRHKSRDLTTDYTWSDTEETESKHRRQHKSTKVTTRHMTARYEDGKLVDKKMKEKKTMKKYKPTAETTTFASETTPSSLYTSSYFMDTTKDGDDKTSSKHSRHHSRHSKHRDSHSHRDDKSLRRSRSEKDIQAVRYKSSGSTRHHDDGKKHGTSELRRSRSDKDVGKSTRSRSRSHSRHRHHGDDETRARSRSRSRYRHHDSDDDERTTERQSSRSRSRSRHRHHDSDNDERTTERRSSRSRSRSRSRPHKSPSRHENDEVKRSNSKKKYVAEVTMVPAVTPPTRRTDIHTVALDPEVSRKYDEEKSSRREKERRHRDKSRERRRHDHEHRHDQTTVVTKKKMMKKETVVRRES